MSLIQSKYAKGQVPVPYPAFAGAVVGFRFAHTLTANPTVNDILELGCIPPGCRVIDVVVDSDDLDSGSPAIAFDVGIMSGEFGDNDGDRICGAQFFAASAASQAGIVVRPTIRSAFRTAPSDKARSVGLKFTAAAATFQAGTIGLTLLLATE